MQTVEQSQRVRRLGDDAGRSGPTGNGRRGRRAARLAGAHRRQRFGARRRRRVRPFGGGQGRRQAAQAQRQLSKAARHHGNGRLPRQRSGARPAAARQQTGRPEAANRRTGNVLPVPRNSAVLVSSQSLVVQTNRVEKYNDFNDKFGCLNCVIIM